MRTIIIEERRPHQALHAQTLCIPLRAETREGGAQGRRLAYFAIANHHPLSALASIAALRLIHPLSVCSPRHSHIHRTNIHRLPVLCRPIRLGLDHVPANPPAFSAPTRLSTPPNQSFASQRQSLPACTCRDQYSANDRNRLHAGIASFTFQSVHALSVRGETYLAPRCGATRPCGSSVDIEPDEIIHGAGKRIAWPTRSSRRI